MSRQSYKASMKEIRAMDLGKLLNEPLDVKLRILGGVSRQAANVSDRLHRAHVKSQALGQFERSLRAQNTNWGMTGYSVPKTGIKGVVKEVDGFKRTVGTVSLDRIVNERLEIMLKFLQGNSTIKDARKELDEFRKKYKWKDATFDDVDAYWAKYDDEMRETVESSGAGNHSPEEQQMLADWYMEDYSKEDLDVLREYLQELYPDEPIDNYSNRDILNAINFNDRLDILIQNWKDNNSPSAEFRKGRGKKV